MNDGVILRVTESFAQPENGSPASSAGRSVVNGATAANSPAAAPTAASSGRSSSQSTLAPPKPQYNPISADGCWDGKCKCGVTANRRTTKKPGANHGRAFFSCGKWKIVDKSKGCGFFLWETDAAVGGSGG